MYGANLQCRADSTRGASGGRGHGQSALHSRRCFIDWAQGLTDTSVWSSASSQARSWPARVRRVWLQSNMDERICLETSQCSSYMGVLILHGIGGDREELAVNYQLRSSWLFFVCYVKLRNTFCWAAQVELTLGTADRIQGQTSHIKTKLTSVKWPTKGANKQSERFVGRTNFKSYPQICSVVLPDLLKGKCWRAGVSHRRTDTKPGLDINTLQLTKCVWISAVTFY